MLKTIYDILNIGKRHIRLDYVPENVVNKDAPNGYVGLTRFKINFKNTPNTFTSYFTNDNTASRVYTFQDRDGIIADNNDLALKSNLNANNKFIGHNTFQGRLNVAVSVGGSPNAIIASYSPSFTAWVDRMYGVFRATGMNTISAPTFSPDRLPPKIIVKENLVPLLPGDIAGAGYEVQWIYNGSADRVVLLNPKADRNILGTIANIVTVQTREQGLFSAPVSGNGTVIAPLNLMIIPKKAGNRIILEWVINGWCHHDVVYLVTRNNVLLPNTTNPPNNRWAGIATHMQTFDIFDIGAVLSNIVIKIIDDNCLDVTSTYRLHIRASGSIAYVLHLNRSSRSTGADRQEACLSTAMAMEVWT